MYSQLQAIKECDQSVCADDKAQANIPKEGADSQGGGGEVGMVGVLLHCGIPRPFFWGGGLPRVAKPQDADLKGDSIDDQKIMTFSRTKDA